MKTHIHHSESRTWGIAARKIAARIEASNAFRAAFALAVSLDVAATLQIIREDGVGVSDTLRAIGGNSELARRAIRAACKRVPGCADPVGSALLPATVRSHLLAECVERVRATTSMAVQRAQRAACAQVAR